MPTLSDLGQRIRLARRARGWSAIELAARAGMHRNTLLAMETGRGNIELGKLLSLCSELGLELLLVPQQAAPMRVAEAHEQEGNATELTQRLQHLMQQGPRS